MKINLNMYADDHQFYAMSSDIEIVNDSLTQSAMMLQSGILPTSLKATLIIIESSCLVANWTAISISSSMTIKL